MMIESALTEGVVRLLRCPACGSDLRSDDGISACRNAVCGARYPSDRGVPVLLPEHTPRLAFRNDYENRPTRWRKVRQRIRRRLPNIVLNVGGNRAITSFLDLLTNEVPEPVILNIGEKHEGPVLRALKSMDCATLIQLDYAVGPETNLVADCRHLPFGDASIDAVVIDSGLEHVPEPRQAVDEIRRVLRPEGLVYVDLPFMMPVHAGPCDYLRFSSAGLRALFRHFDEIERGLSCGPGMVLSQTTQYFLLSFVRQQPARVAVKLLCRSTLFWLKYVDYYLARKPGAMDAAGGTYFIGRRGDTVASDEEIMDGYRGIVPSIYEPLEANGASEGPRHPRDATPSDSPR